MIYLDYSSTTQMSLEALNAYTNVSKEYFGDIAANNGLGRKSKQMLIDTTKELSDLFSIMDSEIIYTSGATEANNMAIIGACLANHKKGKHVIFSKLEHSSMYDICNYLESMGFEISYVNNNDEGLVIFDDLKRLIREDTILVSISAVNYETGVRQPLKMLRQIIKKENDQVIFHSDVSQALGKTPISFRDVDLASVSAHKVYGPKGIGFLYKNSQVKLMPLLYGNKNKDFKPGTLALPLIVAMKESIKKAVKDLDKKERYVNLISDRLVSKLEKIEGININKSKYCIPHIINISFDHIIAETLANVLSQNDIYVSVNLNNEISHSVMAMYNDLKRSKQTMRISLSHLTTVIEINRFLETFEVEYKKLNNLIGGE